MYEIRRVGIICTYDVGPGFQDDPEGVSEGQESGAH
jgi:hypothetical protein